MILQPVIVPVPQGTPRRRAEHVKLQRCAAREALRRCAALCGAPTDGWTKDTRNVPIPNDGFFWSVSHKPHYAAAVVSYEPVGIDVERIAPRPRRLHDALATLDEWDRLGDRSWDGFFRLWTAKEATLKAKGFGIAGFLSCKLTDVPNDSHLTLEFDGVSWNVEHLRYADHLVAVTRNDATVRWQVIEETSKRRKVEKSKHRNGETSKRQDVETRKRHAIAAPRASDNR